MAIRPLLKIMLGIVTVGAVIGGTVALRTVISDEELPAPPQSLKDRLPAELAGYVQPGLVFVYKDNESYHLFLEEVVAHSCPERPGIDPEACFSTAQHVVWSRTTPDAIGSTSGHNLALPEPPLDAEILWRGVPYEGSIGAHSRNACERIELFEGSYECRGDKLVFVAEDNE